MNYRPLVLLGFILFSVLIRFFSFFPSVINHDESTYLVIADALLEGKVYWKDYIDVKPVGIFILLAGVQFFIGKSIFLFRLFTAVWLALTAFGLYHLQLQWSKSERAGIASGLIFLILNSLYTFYGVSPNTESFFTLFTVLAALLIFRPYRPQNYLLAGFLMGLGFVIKYVVLFDLLAFGLVVLIQHIIYRKPIGSFLVKGLLVGLAFLLPFLLTCLYYYQIGQWDSFVFYSFTVPGRYPGSPSWWQMVKFPFDFLLRFLPISIFYFVALFSKAISSKTKRFGIIWSVFALLVVMIPGKWYGHYFIQFMLPFSFIAGQFFIIQRDQLPGFIRWFVKPKVGFTTLGLVVGLSLYFQWNDYIQKEDSPRAVYEYLEDKLEPEDNIFMANHAPIVYYLLGKKCPTKYVHTSLLWDEHHFSAMDIDLPAEIASVKAANPKFVLVRKSLRDDRFKDWLEFNYTLIVPTPVESFSIFQRNQ